MILTLFQKGTAFVNREGGSPILSCLYHIYMIHILDFLYKTYMIHINIYVFIARHGYTPYMDMWQHGLNKGVNMLPPQVSIGYIYIIFIYTSIIYI